MCVNYSEKEYTTNDYYVYEHIRNDNNTCFYVGKGHGNRLEVKWRNEHHDRIVRKYGMSSKIIADNLSEQEAYDLEQKTILNYVYNLGYGIDIIGFNNNPNEKGHLTNHTFGGDGSYGMVHSEDWKKQHSIDMGGNKNPMYGINVWDSYSNEKKELILKKISNSSTGKNNPMYGISPEERMDHETYIKWREKIVARGKSLVGQNNPNYGNDTLHNKVKNDPKLRIQYYSRKGSQNGRSKKVRMFNSELALEFNYIGECCQWLKSHNYTSATIDCIRSSITKSIKKNKEYIGFKFEFI